MRTVSEGTLQQRNLETFYPSSRRTAATVAALTATLILGACAGEGSAKPDSAASSSSSAGNAKTVTPHTTTTPKATCKPNVPVGSSECACPPGGIYEASKRTTNGNVQLSRLVGTHLRIGKQACYESVVIQFDGKGTWPGIHAQYVKPPIKSDPSDKTIPVDGKAFLQLSIGASLHDAAGDTTIPTLTPGPQEGPVNKAVVTSDFEGQSTVVIGLSEKLPFTLSDVSGTQNCPDFCEAVNIRLQ